VSSYERTQIVSRPNRLRVLTLLDTLLTGGAERVAVNIATRLDRERFDPIICVSRQMRRAPLVQELAAAHVPVLPLVQELAAAHVPVLPLVQELDAAHVPVLPLDRAHRGALWEWAPLVRALRESTHVVHSHKFGSNVWGALLGALARVPVVIAHEHGSERDRFHYVVDRLIGRGVDAFIAVSEAERAHLIEVEGLDPEKVRVIRNGIEKLPPLARDLRRDLGLPRGGPVIGTLAVLRPEKALEVLVKAAALLAPRFSGLRVVIAGAGPEEHRLRLLVHELRLEETVLLIGFRTDIADVLAALDIAVFSSDREGMPLAMIEAMAAGKAIVATRIAGIPELVRDGEEALLVPPRDPAALADAVARLLEDAELRNRLASRAQERQRRELDIRSTVEAFEQLYEELYARSSRGGNRARALVAPARSQAEHDRG
jgi:glycosyltransferase involved in cell wall biosynthesis